jgi:hypothetical protein
MKPLLVVAVCLGTLLACVATNHRTIITFPDSVGKEIKISGFLTKSGVDEIVRYLRANPQPPTMLFSVCSGGELAASVTLANEIRRLNVKTHAAGYVASGCAFAFLAGTERSVDAKTGVGLHFHAPSRDGRIVDRDTVDRLIATMEQNTNGRFPGIWKDEIFSRVGHAGVFFFSSNTTPIYQDVMICERELVPTDLLDKACHGQKRVSFEELGLVTPKSN